MVTVSLRGAAVHPDRDAARRPLLCPVDCTLQPGEITLLVGRTGAGKSTFLLALAGLVPLTAGSIHYGDVPLWDGERIGADALGLTALSFQYPERQMFAQTLRREFRYSLRPLRLSKEELQRRTQEGMRTAGLPEALLEEAVMTLSEGQKRRAALAVTLAVKPAWLLLDEPTAGIDPAGIPPLLDAVLAHKRSGGGVVIASHDLDTFFPVADRVIVIREGALAGDGTPEAWCADPGPLLAAGVGVPASVQLAAALAARGIGTGPLPLAPAAAAAAIRRRLEAGAAAPAGPLRSAPAVPGAPAEPMGSAQALGAPPEPPVPASVLTAQAESPAHTQVPSAPGGPLASKPMHAAPAQLPGTSPASAAAPEPAQSASPDPAEPPDEGHPWIRGRHPVAKWLAYLLVSAAMLPQDTWAGLGAGALLLGICLAAFRLPPAPLLKPLRSYLIFLTVSCLLAGIRWGPGAADGGAGMFSAADASVTLRLLSNLALVMLLGFVFVRVTGQRGLRQGLDQVLGLLSRTGLRVGTVSLYAALLLRMIPQLLQEIERMSLIVRSRGRARVKPGSIRLRDVPPFLVPLLLSMMKSAEDLALALEARGCRIEGPSVRSRAPIRWDRNDLLLLGLSAGVVLLLLCLALV
ncbi:MULTISPECIES: ATP-binding cassette domain-containing protein [Paenibacillus]|uniref:ATP-binding cassette domain-containing protein n=1 Tax=Paenibacillus TaxID=44249 RepID=UPI0022B8F2A2|nr:ATP-binding cassette domain-containing protein [Paenibacillus caseinilyticus]MCZ8518522.1 ATP-binding cassette domain-containing protein [Paenibacillus caseinilyticus]